jgi:prepilin-type processing-associated H-X9-DG protein
MGRFAGFIALAIATILAGAGAAYAQQAEGDAGLDRVAAEQRLTERVDQFAEMGLEREVAVFFALMEHSGMEPGEILAFFMMAEHGGEGAGMLLNAMKQTSPPAQPTVIEGEDGGREALIVDGGVLYRIDLETMQVVGEVPYAAPKQADRDAIWSLLVPLMAEWEGGGAFPGGPEAAACADNLRRLGRAFTMYAEQNEGALPGENWVQALTPYLENPQELLRCPARPDLAVGYAMNAKMAGVQLHQIVEPAERILLFDTALQAESPVGGAEALPEGIVHEDGVIVLFADGRVEWLETAEAREMLGFPIGE